MAGSRYTPRDIILAWAIGAPLIGLITFVRSLAGDTKVSDAALYGVVGFGVMTVLCGLMLGWWLVIVRKRPAPPPGSVESARYATYAPLVPEDELMVHALGGAQYSVLVAPVGVPTSWGSAGLYYFVAWVFGWMRHGVAHRGQWRVFVYDTTSGKRGKLRDRRWVYPVRSSRTDALDERDRIAHELAGGTWRPPEPVLHQ